MDGRRLGPGASSSSAKGSTSPNDRDDESKRADAMEELSVLIRMKGSRAASAGAASEINRTPAHDQPDASLVGGSAGNDRRLGALGENSGGCPGAVKGASGPRGTYSSVNTPKRKVAPRRMLPSRQAVVAANGKRAKSEPLAMSAGGIGDIGGISAANRYTMPKLASDSADKPVDEAADGSTREGPGSNTTRQDPAEEPPADQPSLAGSLVDEPGASSFDESGAAGGVSSESPAQEHNISDVGVEGNFDYLESSLFDGDEFGGLFDFFEPGDNVGSAA